MKSNQRSEPCHWWGIELRVFFGVQTKHLGRLPVVNFAAGGVATPADAALMMQMGMDGVFVGSGIFKAGDPAKRARAIVQVLLLCTFGPLFQEGPGEGCLMAMHCLWAQA